MFFKVQEAADERGGTQLCAHYRSKAQHWTHMQGENTNGALKRPKNKGINAPCWGFWLVKEPQEQ